MKASAIYFLSGMIVASGLWAIALQSQKSHHKGEMAEARAKLEETRVIADGVMQKIEGVGSARSPGTNQFLKMIRQQSSQPGNHQVTRALFEQAYAFKPTAEELGLLFDTASRIAGVKDLPPDQFLPQQVEILRALAMNLGPGRADELWRAMEAGTAEIVKAIEEKKLPDGTLEKWESLRDWARGQVKAGVPWHEEFAQRVESVFPEGGIRDKSEGWIHADSPAEFAAKHLSGN